MRITWLAVLGDKLLRLHVVWLPIEIENLIFGPQIIFRVTVAIQTPGHAVRLGDVNRRHVVHRTVAAETTDAPIHVRRVIVVNIINSAITPHPRSCDNTDNPSPVGSHEYHAETAPAGSVGIRLLCTLAWRNTT